MKSSEGIKNIIKKEETFQKKAYKDGFDNQGKQLYSIGYGHQIQPNEKSLLTATLTEPQAASMFERDLLQYENAVNRTKRPLLQNQYDALVSFAYNAGVGSVAKVLETWNATGDSLATTTRMNLYIKWKKNGVLVVNPGLVSRRKWEIGMFLSIVNNVVAEAKKKEHS